MIDELAVDAAQRGKGYGGILLRFADTLVRSGSCRSVELNALQDKVAMYEGFGYRLVAGREPIVLDDETYLPMARPVLYHQSPLH